MCKCGVGEDARRRRSSGDEIKSKSPHEDLRCGEKEVIFDGANWGRDLWWTFTRGFTSTNEL